MEEKRFTAKMLWLFSHPKMLCGKLFLKMDRNHWLNFLSDELFIKLKWKVLKGYPLNLRNPQTFNEKLQWLKLYYHKKDFTTWVDKFAVKDYIAQKIGEEHVIPLLGVWDRPEDIDFSKLPDQFVLKCNHTSGIGLVICKDKSKLDTKKAIKELNRGLKDNYYKRNREWPYKDVKRKVFAEAYKVDESGRELKDYKLYCFNGKPIFCQVDFGKEDGKNRSDFTRNIYDMDWNLQNVQYSHPNDPSRIIPKPMEFEKMKRLAHVLSKGEPFLRVDFYNVGHQIYFSEITFYPIAALGRFVPQDWDTQLGQLIQIPTITKK